MSAYKAQQKKAKNAHTQTHARAHRYTGFSQPQTHLGSHRTPDERVDEKLA